MKLFIICRVIDNLGDAGFSLRLALSLCKFGHEVRLLIDCGSTLKKIQPKHLPKHLFIHPITSKKQFDSFCTNLVIPPHATIECFGSSSNPHSPIENAILQKNVGQHTWLIIEYLTAERWNEDFHLKKSINPQTGFESTYVYPGFTRETGGLIYLDLPQKTKANKNKTNKIFIFSYPQAPLNALIENSKKDYEIHCINSTPLSGAKSLSLCAIDDFDQRLQQYDWCFIRGEDSFVRAQLNGLPFVWQVYKTTDHAHEAKLQAFFNLYTQNMPPSLKDKLKTVWWGWNGLTEENAFVQAWLAIQSDYQALLSYTENWALTLLGGNELTHTVEFLAKNAP